MARTSRKAAIRSAVMGEQLPTAAAESPQKPEKVWNTCGYARLSVFETRDRKDSEALGNQKELLSQYILRHADMRLCEVYADNGETGTNFDRSDFQRMMTDIRSGRVNCIVVKDLSRFGRNYIETGNYLEHILPYLGVRFISINDGYDSTSASSGDVLKAALKNLINQVYSMDISRKSGSVLREKQKRGEFIGTFASYGYLRDPDNPHRIIVDMDTAPTVQEIFARRDKGESYTAITRWLNATHIPTPYTYLYQKGLIKDGRYAAGDKKWAAATVKLILKSQVYLGHTVQGRRRSEFYAGRLDRHLAPSEWTIVKNTHTPLVSQELFDRVQARNEQQRQAYQANLGKYDYLGAEENLFCKRVYCADCGRNMVRYKQVNGGKHLHYAYICPNYATNLEHSGCTYKWLDSENLKNAVYKLLENELRLAADMDALLEKQTDRTSPQLTYLNDQINRAETGLIRLEGLRERLVRDFCEGVLERSDYEQSKAIQEKEYQEMSAQLDSLKKERDQLVKLTGRENPWLTTFCIQKMPTELTREIVQALVKRIDVYEGNRVEIQLNYRDEREALMASVFTGKEDT